LREFIGRETEHCGDIDSRGTRREPFRRARRRQRAADDVRTARVEFEINRHRPDTFFEPVDVTDVPALKAAIERLAARTGGVDVLVNNVANDQRHTIDEITPEFFDERIAVNLRPHFFATQAVLGSMRGKGGGSIVNIGSGSWKNKTPNLSVYATAKSAMLGFTRCLARDLGRDGIRVNCVVPGWTMTERQVSLWVDAAGEAEMDRQHCIPGRIVGADIAHMVLFLAADTARMVTAQEFVVDAGWA